jgi:putative hydrolase
MSDVPFGFSGGPLDPRDPDEGGSEGPGGQPFDLSQLGSMLSQLGNMLSQSGSGSAGAVNYEMAKNIAIQQFTNAAGMSGAERTDAVTDAIRLAEVWLDPVTSLPAGSTKTEAWSPRDWVEHTIATWQRLCDPVATRMSTAWLDAMPEEAKAQAGPFLAMIGQMGGMAFGTQLGQALAQLGGEVLTSSDIGLPLGPAGVAALIPSNVDKFTTDLERPASEVLVFLAAREAAHQRLFGHVPWLRQRLLGAVEEFARGITIDTSAIEQLASQVDPQNPESIQQAMSAGAFEPATTPEQQAALARLETLLALVEGWVDIVVAEALTDRLPGTDALREILRRRRATGGPAEQTFATLVGLELRPRQLRSASALWKFVTDQHGVEVRDALWNHPDLLPNTIDLENPTDFTQRLGDNGDLDDPIAAIQAYEARKRDDEAQ